jgi:SAM-dependent methyltransferase
MDEKGPPPSWELMRLIDGFVTTQLLYVAAKLGIADQLTGGPRSGAELAEAVGADAGALGRVLRGLVIEDVLAEVDGGRFALTPLGECLVPLRGSAIARGELYYESAAGLIESVKTGGAAFEHVHGERFFDYLAEHPDQEATFQGSMAGRSEQEAAAVVAAYDFTGLRRLIDVGGGRGILLAQILDATPHLHGVLFDRPAAIAAARRHLDERALADRTECVGGDFFESVPAGADGYLLSRVLHDWNDGDAGRILAACRRAMGPGSRLVIVEAILPVRAKDRPATIRMDLHMLLLFRAARERTEAEFRALLDDNGFALSRAVMTASPAGLGVIEAIPIPAP